MAPLEGAPARRGAPPSTHRDLGSARHLAEGTAWKYAVLAAEPLYLLFDLAVVGRLGAVSLAALAIGALIMGVLSSQLTFLAYGTTARAARFYGIGDRRAAIGEGVQATWLALGIGTAIVLTGASGLSGDGLRVVVRCCRSSMPFCMRHKLISVWLYPESSKNVPACFKTCLPLRLRLSARC